MNFFSQKKPFIVAGPCGAESEEQLQQWASRLPLDRVQMIRAGVWKPRSKPGHFEGRGEVALSWLVELRAQTGLPVCTEVANKEQVALVLKYGLDAVWIGARSTVNPFLVQEIADALQGTHIPVMIKNPINPDIELWSGAVERFLKSGTENLAAIHRGFSSYDPSTIYRNKPNWALPIELKRRYAELPMLCDISHISGNRTLLHKVAQRALDLDFDGLMIESHPNPDNALSDAQQQITPEVLITLLDNLEWRNANTTNVQEEIDAIRLVLDSMDAEIVDMIGKRMEMVRTLGPLKRAHNIPIYQTDRWREILETRTQWGKNNGLPEDFIFRLFELIHDKSIKIQCEE